MNNQQALAAFAERLRKGLRYRRLTQHECAARMHINYSLISKWARAKRWPTAPMLILLARTLDVSLDWLLGTRASLEVEKEA